MSRPIGSLGGRAALAIFAAFLLVGLPTQSFADDVYSLGTVVTFGLAGNALNSQGTLTPDVTNTPVLSHINVSGDFTALNGSFENELRLRLIGPLGTFNIQIGTLGATGGVNVPLFSGSGFGTSPTANGTWTYQFFESFDDVDAVTQDCSFANCVIAFRGPITTFPAQEQFRNYLPATTAGTIGVRSNTAGTPGAPGWMEGRGNLAAPVVFSTALISFSTAAIWVQDGFLNAGTVGALSMNTASAARSEWIVSPIFDLGGGAPTFNLSFDLGLTTAGGTGAGTLAADDVLSVLVSNVGGGTWTNAGGQVVATYNSGTPISNLGQTETISLAAFTGARRIGFHFFSSANNSTLDLHLDNVALLPNVATLSIGDVQAVETNAGTTTFNFPVTVTNPGGTINFTVDTVNGSATSPTDFVGITAGAGSVTGAAGMVSVTVNGDAFPEANETFTVNISNPDSGALILDGSALGTILDDDFVCGAPQADPSTYTQATLVGLAADTWRFNNPGARAALAPLATPFAIFDSDNYSDNATAEDVVLNVPTMDLSTSEFVRLEWDEIFRTGFGGRQTVEVSVDGGTVWTPIMDNTAAASGDFATGASAHRIFDIGALAANQADVRVRFRWRGNFSWWWIVDNVQFCTGDLPAGFSIVSISDATGTEGGGANSLQFMVTASPAASAQIDVDYSIANGTAMLGTHYNATATGTVSIPMGGTSVPVNVSPIDDAPGTRNANRTLSASITGISAGPGTLGDANASGVINNDDPLPMQRLFSPNNFGMIGFAEFDPTNVAGTVFNNTVQVPTTSYFGGDFANNDFTTLYATEFLTTNLDAINTTTWNVTRTSLTGMLANHIPGGLAYDYRTNTMWLLSVNQLTFTTWTLNSVNVATGAVTQVANLAPAPVLAIGFAASPNPAATLYIVDQGTGDQLRTINKTTAAVTTIGPLGLDFSNIIGEADFDDQPPSVDGILYFTGVTGGQYQLFSANLTTGAATLVNNIQATAGLQEFSAFGVSNMWVPVELSAFGLE